MKELILLAGVHILAVMSPGPDFAMVMRNSLVYSRRTGLFAAFGLSLGILVHVTYNLLGIGLLISRSILAFNVIKWLGAAYLIYVGVTSLFAKKTVENEADSPTSTAHKKDLSAARAVRLGFLTNVLNPKATLYFLALFTQIIDPNTNGLIKAMYGLETAVITFAWFAFVAMVLTHTAVNRRFSGIKYRLERVFGVVLIALGLKVALGSNK